MYGRRYEADMDPFNLIWVNPAEIENKLEKKERKYFFASHVRGGDWDLKTDDFENSGQFRRVKKVVEDGDGDEKTRELYNSIRKNGYKTQEELSKETVTATSKDTTIDPYLGEINEIMVCIGREGDILFRDGGHRLSIAKILDIESIPVRVVKRHRKWQEKRDRAINNPESLDDRYLRHPDIKPLLKD